MTIVALTHGYPPIWNMGGEVSLHRSLVGIKEKVLVLTKTEEDYVFQGVRVRKIGMQNVLNIKADPRPIIDQLKDTHVRVIFAQNELSLPAVRAARVLDAISVIGVHTPPRFGRNIRDALRFADYAVYNTHVAAKEWGDPEGLVLHPPIHSLPNKISNNGDAYTLLSSLRNKGVTVMLELAARYPNKRFIIVRSPAESTHGIHDLEERAAKLPNVELHPRVEPEEVHKYLKQTRILLVPSMYETYGMSAIEAAGYGIPSIHVDTPHVREGIGEAAVLIKPLDVEGAAKGIEAIENNYQEYSRNARLKAEWLWKRQQQELKAFHEFLSNVKKPVMKNRSSRGSLRR